MRLAQGGLLSEDNTLRATGRAAPAAALHATAYIGAVVGGPVFTREI